MTGPSVSHVNYATGRRGQPQARSKLRIKWFWGEKDACKTDRADALSDCYCSSVGQQVPDFQRGLQTCGQQHLLTAERRQYFDGIIGAATDWLSSAFSVDPVVGPLSVGPKICNGYPCAPRQQPFCGVSNWNDVGIRVPGDHYVSGVSGADFLLYISAVPTGGSTVAWALTCMSDQDGRPFAGMLNFGPSNVDISVRPGTVEYRNYVATAVHEMLHALGFSSAVWDGRPNWFSEHCTALGTANCKPTITLIERGLRVTKIATPEVVKKIREFSHCPTLNGAEVENEGGSGTAGSHWERRVFGVEGMTGVSGVHEAEWSTMTLAYFKDTGWYDVNYDMASPDFFWGKGKGCSFWMDKCNQIQPVSARAPEFCFPDDPDVAQVDCSYHLKGHGICTVSKHGSCLDPAVQYFSKGCQYGGDADALTDYCPRWATVRSTRCDDPAAAPTSDPLDAHLGQTRGANSRCFRSNLLHKDKRYTATLRDLRCFAVECAPDCSSYTITLSTPSGGTQSLTCTAPGAPSAPAGWEQEWQGASDGGPAAVQCWAIADICGDEARAKLGARCPQKSLATPYPPGPPRTPTPQQQGGTPLGPSAPPSADSEGDPAGPSSGGGLERWQTILIFVGIAVCIAAAVTFVCMRMRDSGERRAASPQPEPGVPMVPQLPWQHADAPVAGSLASGAWGSPPPHRAVQYSPAPILPPAHRNAPQFGAQPFMQQQHFADFQQRSSPSPVPSPTGFLAPGTRVQASYGEAAYGGRVLGVGADGLFQVSWDDGSHSVGVPPDALQRLPERSL